VVVARWGSGRKRASESATSFRQTKVTGDAFAAVPDEVARAVGSQGDCALGLAPSAAAEVAPILPARWSLDEHGLFVAARSELIDLVGGARRGGAVGVTVDHASSWRASDMAGVLVQGEAKAFVAEHLRSGARSAGERLRRMGAGLEDWTLMRVSPHRLVWWHGWSSGTVRPG
jgi:hypothetical protein